MRLDVRHTSPWLTKLALKWFNKYVVNDAAQVWEDERKRNDKMVPGKLRNTLVQIDIFTDNGSIFASEL